MLSIQRIEQRGLGIVTFQNVPVAHEPPVVARMAKHLNTEMMAGAEGGISTLTKVGIIAAAFGFFAFSYHRCVKRGACKGF